MKKIILILALTLLTFNGKSQSYIPMIEDSMIVVNAINGLSHPDYILYKYLGDTLINGNTYFKCYQDSVLTDSSYSLTIGMRYHGAIRESSKKIYFVPKDSISEKKIYDFSVNLLDTTLIYYKDLYNDSYFKAHLYQQQSSLPQLNRKIYYYNVLTSMIPDNIVAEGFGNVVYNINEIESDYPTRRTCVIKKNNKTHNIPSNYSQCYQKILDSYVYLAEVNISDLIKIYPNPAISNITIVSDTYKINEVSILDVFGKKFKTISSNSYKEFIDISFLPKGVYIIQVDSNGKVVTKRIVKN